MSSEQQHRGKAGQDRDAAEPTAEAPNDPTSTAEEASERAQALVDDIDDVLDEADQLMRDHLGIDADQKMTDPEVEKAIARAVAGFVQKGGQ